MPKKKGVSAGFDSQEEWARQAMKSDDDTVSRPDKLIEMEQELIDSQNATAAAVIANIDADAQASDPNALVMPEEKFEAVQKEQQEQAVPSNYVSARCIKPIFAGSTFYSPKQIYFVDAEFATGMPEYFELIESVTEQEPATKNEFDLARVIINLSKKIEIQKFAQFRFGELTKKHIEDILTNFDNAV